MKDAFLTFLGIVEYYFKYKRFSSLSGDKVLEFQYKKIRKLLISCMKVPYYQSLFESINFNPKIDFKNLEDLKKIPVLRKDTTRNDPKIFINKSEKGAIKFKTSGTTGSPFEAYVSTKHWIVEQAVIWRHWKWAGYRIFDSMAILRSHNPKSEKDIIKYDKIRRWTYYSPYHLNDVFMELFYKDMVKKQTKFLRGYPSSLSLFAEFCKRKNYKITTLKACLTASEVLTDVERKIIEEAFGVRVFDHYGLAETIVMLHNDGSKDKYFNCNEYGFLELIETENKNFYKIVGTNLNNYAMPLIRYDTEDIAEAYRNDKGEILIKRIIGRKDQYIYNKNNKIPTVNLYTLLYKVDGIIQWQVIQNDMKSLEIYLKLIDDNQFERVTNEIKQLNNTGLEFKFYLTKVFYLSREGKLKPFISNL